MSSKEYSLTVGTKSDDMSAVDKRMYLTNAKRISDSPIATFLGPENIIMVNYRLNDRAKATIRRMKSNNDRTLLTRCGFQIFRTLDNRYVDIAEMNRDFLNMGREYLQKVWGQMWNPANYTTPIINIYNNDENVSERSHFYAKEWMKTLKSYGHNKHVRLAQHYIDKIIEVLEKDFRRWFVLEGRTIKELAETGKWLAHIKEGTNSGMPFNIAQDKNLALSCLASALNIFKIWKEDPSRVNWHKLAFMPGYRTERKKKARVISMACIYEKILSAIVSTVLDSYFDLFPVTLPRKFGAIDNMCMELIKKKVGLFLAKDYHGYDTSIPIHIFEILRDWLKSLGNEFSELVAFLIDIMIHAEMIIGPNMGYLIASLPSGSGLTQFIGSMVNYILDIVFGLDYELSVYQGDDQAGCLKPSFNEKEVRTCLDELQEVTKMELSPIGEKTYLSEDTTIILQTWVTLHPKTGEFVYYGNEVRRFGNCFYKERAFNVPGELVEQITGKNKKEGKVVIEAVGYLGNLASCGLNAPILPNLISFVYGKRSGYSYKQIESAFSLIGFDIEGYDRVQFVPKYIVEVFSRLKKLYGWGSVSAPQVDNVLRDLGRVV